MRPGMRVLDVGCGVGRFSLPLPTAASVGPEGEIIALDPQKEMLDRLNVKAATAGRP